MKKCFIVFLLLSLTARLSAQAFNEGNLVLNANVGVPNFAATITKFALRTAYPRNVTDNSYSLDFSNTPVISGRAEYALKQRLGLGLSMAYWKMSIGLTDNYYEYDPYAQTTMPFVDKYTFNISALALGVRINYHFGKQGSTIDPYIGGALGFTRYSFAVAFSSNYQGKQLPALSYTFKTGFGTYIAPTIGFRVYAADWLGFNFEAGYDKGAMLIAGLAFKINTKNT